MLDLLGQNLGDNFVDNIAHCNQPKVIDSSWVLGIRNQDYIARVNIWVETPSDEEVSYSSDNILTHNVSV